MIKQQLQFNDQVEKNYDALRCILFEECSSHRYDNVLELDVKRQFTDEGQRIAARTLGFRKKSRSVREVIKIFQSALDLESNFDGNHPKGYLRRDDFLPNIKIMKRPITDSYVFFDACLAILDGDKTDAKQYLHLSLNMLGLDVAVFQFLNMLIEYEAYKDKDVRNLLATLALHVEPPSAHCHKDRLDEGYQRRYNQYLEQLKQVGT